MSIQEKLERLLSKDVFKNLSHLKMIERYGEMAQYLLTEKAGDWGGAVLVPVPLSSFDLSLYPEAAYIVYAAASNESMFRAVLSAVPKKCGLVFKVSAPEYIPLIKNSFDVEFVRAFVSYSRDTETGEGLGGVVMSHVLDGELLPLFYGNGYVLDELKSYFKNGAKSFALYKGGEPVSACIVFPNYKHIWELGAVHTAATARRNGYASTVVRAATDYLVRNGKIPNYQVDESNAASVSLAESVGMRPMVRLEHYCQKPGS